MIKKKSRIPKFKTYEEEANFWDTHEFTEFEDELEDVEIVFELNKPRDEAIVLRVQKDLKEKLDKKARSMGLNLSTLARMWLMEKLQENLRRVKT
ncbi:hypothetical protein A3B39_01495 [Candidatus Daviesbacteria bacterium RIFCSPLOWO2_01_FULL_37_10]|nr:MAG: hypothetical protein A3B39_01495 [Candidatus Daviesbacteria bacterium RIFCSPLOWO2_01_FULL_37_10]